jgi:hypothetical protein
MLIDTEGAPHFEVAYWSIRIDFLCPGMVLFYDDCRPLTCFLFERYRLRASADFLLSGPTPRGQSFVRNYILLYSNEYLCPKGPQASRSTSIYTPIFLPWFALMQFIDIINLIFSFFGLYGIVFSIRLLLPRNIVPLIPKLLDEVTVLLEKAEAINIPNVSDYWADLAMYANATTHQCHLC